MSDVEKTATKTARKITAKAEAADVFGLGSAEMPEMFRDVAEKAAKQAKDSYEKIRTAAEEATDMLEDQFETTRTGFMALNAKALDAAKANTDATFKFAKDVMAVKSVAEAIELQTAFARLQYDLYTAQAKEMQDLFQKVGTEVSAPLKDGFSKLLKDARVS
jgi:phasin